MFHSKLHSIYITFSNGLLTNNSTWCQNRGCICISLVRRTYGRIHSSFLHTSSHPDKNNNSVNRIISKERREKIQGENFNLLRVQWCFHKYYKNSIVFPHAIQSSRAKETILHTELILLQEFSKKYYNYKAHPVQAPSSNCSPCLQALHTAGSSYKAPYSIPGPYSTSRLPVILGGRISILHGSQHPRSPYSNSQASSTVLHYKILPGEIGFIPRVKYCISNTILRSVCSNLFILALE